MTLLEAGARKRWSNAERRAHGLSLHGPSGAKASVSDECQESLETSANQFNSSKNVSISTVKNAYENWTATCDMGSGEYLLRQVLFAAEPDFDSKNHTINAQPDLRSLKVFELFDQDACGGTIGGKAKWDVAILGEEVHLLEEPGTMHGSSVGGSPLGISWAGAYSDLQISLTASGGHFLVYPTTGYGSPEVTCGSIDVPNAPDPEGQFCIGEFGYVDNLISGVDSALLELKASGYGENPSCKE